MAELYRDSMAIVAVGGASSLFITVTANPHWEEVLQGCNAGGLDQGAADAGLPCGLRQDVINRVFRVKVDRLLDVVTKKHDLGKCTSYCYTIEWQKVCYEQDASFDRCQLLCLLLGNLALAVANP